MKDMKSPMWFPGRFDGSSLLCYLSERGFW